MPFGWLRPRGRDARPAIRDVVQTFESLGDNCEFGLVQRYVGAEPLGLLRFSATLLDPLVAALDDDFRGYGEGEDLILHENAAGFYVGLSQAYGFAYSTGMRVTEADAATLLKRERTKAAYLKRRLLEDLAAGEKILLRKASPEDSLADILRLSRAVRRHGRCRLLWVRQSGPGHTGPPRLHDATLIEDLVPRFAPNEQAHAIDLEPWLDLCRRVHAHVHGLPAEGSAPVRHRNLLAGAVRRPSLHVTSGGEEILAPPRRSGHLDPTRIHTFSVWVWVPADFAGTRIGGLIGHHRLAYRDADLGRRDCWQRVWISARWQERFHFLTIGLMVESPAGSRFWSTGERLEDGPTPGAAAPPRSAPPGAD